MELCRFDDVRTSWESTGSALYCGLIADPYVHINGCNSVWLSAGSALYCGLIADPYVHINGSNSVWLSAGSALYCGLIADPYVHINGCNSVWLSAGSALYCGLTADPYVHINGCNSVWLSAGSALYCGQIADPYIHTSDCIPACDAKPVALFILIAVGWSLQTFLSNPACQENEELPSPRHRYENSCEVPGMKTAGLIANDYIETGIRIQVLTVASPILLPQSDPIIP